MLRDGDHCHYADEDAIERAEHRHVRAEELRLLQALAHSTSVALESIELYSELEERVAARTRDLHSANGELAATNEALLDLQRQKEALSALLVHDIRSPAATIVLASKPRLREARCPTPNGVTGRT